MENKQKSGSAQVANKGLRRLNAAMFAFFALIVVLGTAAWFTRAASVTSRRDVMSNQTMSVASSHTISFNLSGGNTFASGEAIIVDFPESSAFTTGGSWVIADFAFADGTARTIIDVDAGPGVTTVDTCTAGTNNVGVAVDTTALAFRVLPCATFTPSAAAAFVTFTISGQTPNGTLINPSVAGSYIVGISNAAGDCQAGGDDCRMAVSVVDTSDVNVSATVTSSTVCGNGVVESGESCDDSNVIGGDGCSAICQTEGGGGGPPPDTTPPSIFSITVTSITASGATVNWSTNESSDSTVNYGLTNTYGSQVYDSGLQLSHIRPLTGLTAGTLYHFQVCSKDGSNNQACSTDQTFTTLDTTPPSITSVVVSAITGTSATITWTTDENSSSYVDYATVAGPPYANTTGVAAPLVTSHSVNLTGLTPATAYHYRVRSGDASANESFTADAVFSTLDGTAPIITNVVVSAITGTSATVTWTTNENSTNFVDHGLIAGPPYANTSGAAAPLIASHSVSLTGLTESTVYHYRVRSADGASNEATSSNAIFTTLDGTAPVISAVTASLITPTTARITWTTNENSDSLVDYGTTIAYGSQQTSVTSVTAHQIDLSGLTPNTLYHYRVKSKDTATNEAVSADFTFTSAIPAAPVISALTVTSITQTGASVQWTTSTAADTKVEFGLTNAYGSQSTDATLSTGHVRNLTGLTKGTTYHYRVTSVDAYAQQVQSADGTFATLPDVTAPANVTGLTATPGDSQIGLAWTNPVDADFQGVRLLRKTTGFPADQNDGTLVYSGTATSANDTGLTNGLVYYYAVFAFDDVPNYSSGAVISATPTGIADVTAPGNATSFVATPGNGQVTLTWNNPADPDFQGVRIVRSTTGAPTGPNDGIVVHDGTGTSRLDTGLANGTLYYYAIYAYDAVPNFASGVQAQATPTAPIDATAPGPVTGFVANPGDNQVQLYWTNPTDIDWAGTRVIRKTGSNPTGPNDGTIVFDGVGDNRLDQFALNGTTYYYAAYAYDAQLNYSSATFASATPSSGLILQPLACTDSDGGRNYDVAGSVDSSGQSFSDSCADTTTVTENYCAGTVHTVESHPCGAGYKCSAGSCVPDTFVPTTEVCGNSVCGGTENNLSCPADCPITPVEAPVEQLNPEAQDGNLILADLRFYATTAKIPLRVAGERLTMYAGMSFTVKIPDEAIRKPVKSAFVNLGPSAYAMRQTASFEAVVAAPPSLTVTPFQVIVNYEDDSSETVTAEIETVQRGRVYEIVDGNEVGVGGARVALLVDNGGGNYGLWDGSASGQTNPSITDGSGYFGFVVPEGAYKIQVEREGYGNLQTLPFPVGTENVIRHRMRLLKLPETPVAVAQFVADATVEKVKEIIGNEYIEEGTQNIAAPAAVVAAVANVAAASVVTATALPFLINLWSLLAHPFLLLSRRRRKQWGVVYDALKKLPVDLAIVRLLDAKTGRIMRSAVTDKDGRYFFIVQPGEYKIVAVKAGFVFPSVFLKGQKEDGPFIDLYHGESIVVKGESSITVNVPLDPVVAEKTSRRVLAEGVGRMLQKGLSVIAIVAMLVAVIITPTPVMFLLLAANIILFFVFRRLAVPPKPKNWGIVYDQKTGKPIQNVVARIFETKYNKLLETQVTDTRGRYAFLVGTNVYYVTFEKPGYEKEQKGPVAMTKVAQKDDTNTPKIAQLVAVDVRLRPGQSQKDIPKKGTDPKVDKSNNSTPPTPPAPPSAPTPPPVPPAPVVSPTPPPAPTSPTSAPKIPMELQALANMRAAANTPKPTPPAAPPVTPTAPPVPPAPPTNAGPVIHVMPSPQKLLPDTDHAHPEVKLLEDGSQHEDEK